jgi:hypothetical protein
MKKQNIYNRRTFVKTTAFGLAATALPAMGWRSPAKTDMYGGLKSVHFDASRFFRLEKADRWWLVTPEGSAFLSFGLNHPDPDYVLQEYNKDFWAEKFKANADRNDKVFKEKFIEKVMHDLNYFGMNSLGTHCRKEYYGKLSVPFIQGLFFVSNPYWKPPVPRDFADVYSDAFEKRCDMIAKRTVEPRQNDPFLIGYTLTDSPVLTDHDSAAHGKDPWGGPSPETPTWPRVLRNLGADKSGKQAFISLMKTAYNDISEFNKVYHTQFTSFDSLLQAENWSSFTRDKEVNDLSDNHLFLLDILKRYYTVAYHAIRRYDSNHLIFGDIINAQTAPPDDVVALMTGFSDLVAFQFYGDYDEQQELIDRWAGLSGKPLFHADSSFSVPYKEMPNPIGAVCPDTETRANRFLKYAVRAFSRPDFLGWNWCGWMDSWELWKKERQHTGLQDPFGHYHDPMPEAMSWFGERLYEVGRRMKIPKTPFY